MNIKHIIMSISILCAVVGARAQDTIKIMQYNLLNYGVTTSYCTTTNNNTQDKDEGIRAILDHVKPDIIAVNEFSKLPLMQTNFISNNLNINGVTYWMSDNIINHAQSDIINHIFYNSEKMVLDKHSYIAVKYRDVDVYEFYFKTNTLSMGDTTRLTYLIAHLKAGTGDTNVSERNVTAQKIMNYLVGSHGSSNVMISGDFNLYGADESAYATFTQTATYGNALFVDPIGDVITNGVWNTSSMANYHTQSTHSDNNNCAASGGLDDRFDVILISDEVRYGNKGMRYVTNSYEAVGNDGRHYNKSINAGYNYAVGTNLANYLYNVSDHLPVTLKVVLSNPLDINNVQNTSVRLFAYPNPAKDHVTLHFGSDEPQIVSFDIMTTTGIVVSSDKTYCESGDNSFRIGTSNIPDGFYIVRMVCSDGKTAYCKIVVRK